MVEVFKTNVIERTLADRVLNYIHQTLNNHYANFDLEDCDKILRVQCDEGRVQSYHIISIIKNFGCKAEILPDDDPPLDGMLSHQHEFVFDEDN